jgi:hypothetical protein
MVYHGDSVIKRRGIVFQGDLVIKRRGLVSHGDLVIKRRGLVSHGDQVIKRRGLVSDGDLVIKRRGLVSWRSSNQEERDGISLTGLTRICVPVLRQYLDFQRHMSSFFCCVQ